jgi:acetyl esterase/lipase
LCLVNPGFLQPLSAALLQSAQSQFTWTISPTKSQAAYTSYDEYGEGAPVITRSVMSEFFRWVHAAHDDTSSFILLYDKSFSKFPPVYIVTAECDPLRDDGRTLAAALKDAWVSVREDSYQGMPHCFWFFNTRPEWSSFIENTVSSKATLEGPPWKLFGPPLHLLYLIKPAAVIVSQCINR